VCVCVCVCVCVSVLEDIPGTTRAIFTNFYACCLAKTSACIALYYRIQLMQQRRLTCRLHVAHDRGSVLLLLGDEIPREVAILEVFFPIDNALYSIASGMMTWVGAMYHVLDGEPNIQRGTDNFFGGIHKVMGHSRVSCVKTAEPIETPFRVKTQVSPRNHVLDGCADSSSGIGNFLGLSGPFKSMAIFAAVVAAASL